MPIFYLFSLFLYSGFFRLLSLFCSFVNIFCGWLFIPSFTLFLDFLLIFALYNAAYSLIKIITGGLIVHEGLGVRFAGNYFHPLSKRKKATK